MLESRRAWSTNLFTSLAKLLQSWVLTRDTVKFVDKLRNNQISEYTYEVKFMFLPMINKLFQNSEYKEFYKNETTKLKRYESNTNIKDLYPLEIHTDHKSDNIIALFNKLNTKILTYEYIDRRVTKKQIVYKTSKGNKTKSIFSLELKKDKVNFFTLPFDNQFDKYNKFDTIPIKSCKPLERRVEIHNIEDATYVSKVIDLITNNS